jgi:F0F1-type ATP synthase membrane subunit b/b'
VLDDGKAKIEDLSEDTRNRMADLKAETRSLLEGIGKDARLVVDEVVSGSRQAVALQIAQGAHGLARRANRLNKKLEAFHRSVAA